jgi:hypothetical protein
MAAQFLGQTDKSKTRHFEEKKLFFETKMKLWAAVFGADNFRLEVVPFQSKPLQQQQVL